MMADQSPRLTSLSPGAGCACKLPLAKLEALFATMGPYAGAVAARSALGLPPPLDLTPFYPLR